MQTVKTKRGTVALRAWVGDGRTEARATYDRLAACVATATAGAPDV
ncbi:MAG: hypothetical protein AAF928_03170 [Myxococcota bacterium]